MIALQQEEKRGGPDAGNIGPAKCTAEREDEGIRSRARSQRFSGLASARADRYELALRTMPASGGGGAHAALLGVANLGVRAGLTGEQIARDLRGHAHGERRITDTEIHDAVAKAMREAGGPRRRVVLPPPRPHFDAGKLLRGILEAGDGAGEVDLFEASPIRIDWEPQDDAARLMRLLYQDADVVFIGERYDTGAGCVRPAADWARRFEQGEQPGPHVIPNPMTGQAGQKKDGKASFRADACVCKFRFAVVEFDAVPPPLRVPAQPGEKPPPWPREDQIRFWAGCLRMRFPIAALIDSGGKSVHAWLHVGAADEADWTTKVERELFPRYLTPLGVDPACRNESRLSRMPGHLRDNGRRQRLLYLDPQAGEEVDDGRD